MANIPVERTSTGTPWWVWLLGLLLLIGLIWFIAELVGDDDDDYVAEDPVGVVDEPTTVVAEPVETTGADAITSIAGLAEGRTSIGRQVNLDNVRVITVTGDSSFFIGSSPGAEDGALVVLENLGESETYATGPEGADGRYNVDEGDMVDVEGVIAAFDESVPDYADMTAADRDRAMRSGIYINAQDVEAASDDTEVMTEGAAPSQEM